MAALSAELELLKQQHTLQADELQATVDAAQKARYIPDHVQYMSHAVSSFQL